MTFANTQTLSSTSDQQTSGVESEPVWREEGPRVLDRAESLLRAREDAEAESALRAASIGMMMSRQSCHRELAEVMTALAWLYDRNGRAERAADTFQRAIRQASAAGMLRCEFGLKMCTRYAEISCALGRYDAAAAACTHGLELAQELHRGASLPGVSLLEIQGQVRFAAGDLPGAAQAWRQALSLCSRVDGAQSSIGEKMRSLSASLAGLYSQHPEMRNAVEIRHGADGAPAPAPAVPVAPVTLKTTMLTPKNEVFTRETVPAASQPRQLRPAALRGTTPAVSVTLTRPQRPSLRDEPPMVRPQPPAPAARTRVETVNVRAPRIVRRRILPDGAPDLFLDAAPHYE